MKRGEGPKANPETTRAWQRRSAEKAAAKRPQRPPLRRRAPDGPRPAQRASSGRPAAPPEASGGGGIRQPRTPRPGRAADQAARRAVRRRSKGRCEVRIPGVCEGQATNYHHRQPRGMGGTRKLDTEDNYIHICGQGNYSGCHGWIERNRDEARQRGWLVPHPTDPATVPWSPMSGGTP